MKIYNKIGIFAAAALLSASCAVNDPFADNMDMGKVVPTVSWELNSSVCKAGNDAGFLGKYYTTEKGVTIDRSEVWGMITRTESAAATVKLVTSPAYTQTVNFTDTVRGFHLMASFEHDEKYLKGTEYQIEAAFPTSRTLSPVSWANPTEFDNETFALYYPADFKGKFCATMVEYLTGADTYLSSLRSVYANYGFTQEDFDAVNGMFPNLTPLPFSDSQVEGETMGDLWFDVDTKTVVGYYYIKLKEDGTAEEVQIESPEMAPEGVSQDKVFPVYKAPHWLYSRYSDNTGGAVTSMKEEYRPVWKALVELIPFEAWIYNSGDQNYAVEFTRKYIILSQFQVVDSKEGVGKDTDYKSLELN